MAARSYFVRLLTIDGNTVFRSSIWARNRQDAERQVRKMALEAGIQGITAALIVAA